MGGLTMQYQYKNLCMFFYFSPQDIHGNIKYQFSIFFNIQRIPKRLMDVMTRIFTWRFKEQIDQGGVLEIVISDQLAVNNVTRHVLNVIRHVLIKISTNRSGPSGDSPIGPVSCTKRYVTHPFRGYNYVITAQFTNQSNHSFHYTNCFHFPFNSTYIKGYKLSHLTLKDGIDLIAIYSIVRQKRKVNICLNTITYKKYTFYYTLEMR